MIASAVRLLAALLIVAASGPVAVGLGADAPSGRPVTFYNDVEQTVHNFLPPGSVLSNKELCGSCHVDGNFRIPGLPVPPEEAALPAAGTDRELRPLWNQETAVTHFDLPKNWPLPQAMFPDRPFGTSADCLGCHDGAFAEDVHRGGPRYGQSGNQDIEQFLDRMELALGGALERKSEVPDHPISVIYPRKPDGELIPKRPVSSELRYFSIPDLRNTQLVLPTGPTSRFYAQTPGNMLAAPPGHGNGTGQGQAAASPAGMPAAAEGPEQFRLVHTTFGVVHCDSCHNAHSELHAGFLRDTSPQLCLLCHDR